MQPKTVFKWFILIMLILCGIPFIARQRHINPQIEEIRTANSKTDWILLNVDFPSGSEAFKLMAKKIVFEDHQYILFNSYNRLGVVHDPACECNLNKGEQK